MALFDSLIGMALLGGTLVGSALGILTLLTGRVMSGSSMVGSLLGGAEGVAATSIAFIGGLVGSSLIMSALGFAPQPVTETSWPLLVIGGLLVGVSVRLGGASLGAVVSGIARRAPRSIFMLLSILIGATVGGILQMLFGAGSGA